jgi:hypothetical protein
MASTLGPTGEVVEVVAEGVVVVLIAVEAVVVGEEAVDCPHAAIMRPAIIMNNHRNFAMAEVSHEAVTSGNLTALNWRFAFTHDLTMRKLCYAKRVVVPPDHVASTG